MRRKKTPKRRAQIFEMTKTREVIRPYSYKLALRMTHYRKQLNLTQLELSEKTGVSQKVISYMESGWANPSLFYLIQISNAFGVSLDDLIGKRSSDRL